MIPRKGVLLVLLTVLAAAFAAAQNDKSTVLTAQDLKKAVPSSFFFRGQSAPVQLRNSVGFRASGGKLVLAGLVDTSGYASDIKEKYQGFFITEIKVKIDDSEVSPGQYGFGFKDGKFLVMDVGANDVASVASKKDDQMAHPVPLKLVQDGNSYKLYQGKNWVSITPE